MVYLPHEGRVIKLLFKYKNIIFFVSKPENEQLKVNQDKYTKTNRL